MANEAVKLQKKQIKISLFLLVLSAIFPFLVLANPVPMSDDWEDWLESQAQIEQTLDENENEVRLETVVPQPAPAIPCPDPVECGIL